MKVAEKLFPLIKFFTRWFLSSIFFVGIIGGILSANVSKLAEQNHWDSWLIQCLAFLSKLTSPWWFWLSLGLVGGASLILWIAKLLPESKEVKWNENAHLTLTFDSELQNGSPLKQEGVRYYYWYHFPAIAINFDARQTQPTPGYIMVFLSLKDPTYTNYSRVRVVGGGILCEVISTHCSGAVVRASGDMRGRTLEILFSKEPIPVN